MYLRTALPRPRSEDNFISHVGFVHIHGLGRGWGQANLASRPASDTTLNRTKPHTCIHTRKHTHTHTCTQTHEHHIHLHNINSFTHMHTYTRKHTHTHAYIHAHKHISTTFIYTISIHLHNNCTVWSVAEFNDPFKYKHVHNMVITQIRLKMLKLVHVCVYKITLRRYWL